MKIFNSYKDIEDKIVDWLDREDVREHVHDFIRLCTLDITRTLRVPIMEKTLLVPVMSNGSAKVPSNLAELKGINWVEYSEGDNKSINILKRHPLNRSSIIEYNKKSIDVNKNIPSSFARIQGNYKIFPLSKLSEEITSEGTTNLTIVGLVEVIYYSLPEGLQEDSSTNWIVDVSPDLYLFGGLMHSFRYVRDFDKASYWEDKYNKALSKVQLWADLDEWSGGPIVVGVSNG